MRYILTLDQGTTSSRALLIDHFGAIKCLAQKEFRQIFPEPGLVEHDPQEIWESQAAVIKHVLAESGISLNEIGAIGLANQRETTIVWERKTGKPIYNAIVWQDRRTANLCKKLKDEGYEPLVREKTGLLLDPYFSATKLHWILQHVPGALARAKLGELAFGTVDSWLVWNLTGGKTHLTDITNASRTSLFNIHTCQWDPELLALFDIPSSLLPAVHDSSEVYAKTSCSLFSEPLPIAGIAGDQQAALFAQMCTKAGMVKNTYGTGCFMLINTGNEVVLSTHHLLSTIAYKIGNTIHYALEGSIFIAGAAIQWLRDEIKLIKTSSEIEKLASSVPDSGGVYFVPAFTGLGAPYWDPDARGMLLGITRGTTAAHIARATIEAIAHQVADLLEAMQADLHGYPIQELRIDGGAAKDDLLLQMQANLLGIQVLRASNTELTALGAAYLAGLAVGFWNNQEEIASHWKIQQQFNPQMEESKRKEQRKSWQQAIKCVKLWGAKG